LTTRSKQPNFVLIGTPESNFQGRPYIGIGKGNRAQDKNRNDFWKKLINHYSPDYYEIRKSLQLLKDLC